MTDKTPLALYVHWPWCLSKCPYCDFNSRARLPDVQDQAAYRTAILAELKHFAELTKDRAISSIFFGGGTPSLMDPATVHDIISTADQLWGFTKNCEITLEANPTSIEAAKFRGFRDAGVNRVSVGIQSLNNKSLQQLGREHSVQEALQALDIARAIFNRYTFDIIYARPDQGLGEWHDELEQALELADDHISLYQLTIEPGTNFFRDGVEEASPDLGADFYELTQDLTKNAGLPSYEVSNHAKPGQESRHNLTYWQGHDYLGLGPGAHGRLTQNNVTSARHQIADPQRWQAQIADLGHGTAKTRILSNQDRLEERILSGLRLTDGIDCEVFARQTGLPIMDAVNADALAFLQGEGLVKLSPKAFKVTQKGRLVVGAIIEKLLV
ncbi:MAG: coproporphyrinogen III oxidase [Rhodospirillaceae bacterium]|nr:MAG: coproporphyrinogen III oxidase [Rhodospirillaceae bacterium]